MPKKKLSIQTEQLFSKYIPREDKRVKRLKATIIDEHNLIIEPYSHYESFYKEKSIQLTTPSLNNYKWKIEPFIEWLIINASDTDKMVLLNQNVINDYILHLQEQYDNKSTINSYLRCIKTFILWCTNYHNIAPIKIQVKQDSSFTTKTPYTDDELKRLIAPPKEMTFTNLRNWCIILTFIATGIRCRSLINLKVSDILFDKGYIIIREAKGDKPYTVNIDEYTLSILKKWIGASGISNDELLFPNQFGEQFHAQAMSKLVARYNRSRGVAKTSPHLFRHTFATMQLRRGTPVEQLRKMMNHSDIATTLIYAHMNDIDVKRSYDKANIIASLKN